MNAPKPLSRRQFLKLASLFSLTALTPSRWTRSSGRPNVLVVVFDAWSANNVSLYGYPRTTMPQLERLAERAIVYHHHYAAAPWTVPGTASLLTGTLPWTHRAFTVAQSKVVKAFKDQNLFSLFQADGYFTAGYSHNIFVDQFLFQFKRYLDQHTPNMDLLLKGFFPFSRLLPKDPDAAALAQIRAFFNEENNQSSLFLGGLMKDKTTQDLNKINAQYREAFPRGVPSLPVPEAPFLLEEGIDHLIETASNSPTPNLIYYHFYPPHQPYNTRREFVDVFANDGFTPPEKPDTIINEGKNTAQMNRERQYYDEFLLYVDAEFTRLYQSLEAAGALENTWLVLTSDHGELFERGNIGHEIPTGLEAAIHVPLLIFPPGGASRVDVHANTSAIDVLPTLLHLTGQEIPAWVEGLTLPPFNPTADDPSRSLFSFHPANSRSFGPVSEGSATIVQDQLKLIYSFGINKLGEHDPLLELYNLQNDPEELVNLYTPQSSTAAALLKELRQRITAADQPFSR